MRAPHPPTMSSHPRDTSSASDFLVERQVQKCPMCVTFSLLLHRSLVWSPLHRERKARLSSFHLAGKATYPLRAGATMSTRPPMVSPALGSILCQSWGGGGPISLGRGALSSFLHLLGFRLFLWTSSQRPQGNLAFPAGLGGSGPSLWGEGFPSRLGSSSEPHNHRASSWNSASWSGAVRRVYGPQLV